MSLCETYKIVSQGSSLTLLVQHRKESFEPFQVIIVHNIGKCKEILGTHFGYRNIRKVYGRWYKSEPLPFKIYLLLKKIETITYRWTSSILWSESVSRRTHKNENKKEKILLRRREGKNHLN